MTFKDILRHSRTMSYRQLNRLYIRCIKNEQFRAAEALNCMLWLNSFSRTNPRNKIRMWKYAIITYNIYKHRP